MTFPTVALTFRVNTRWPDWWRPCARIERTADGSTLYTLDWLRSAVRLVVS